MSRTDGTMKVTVFEQKTEGISDRSEMLAIANLFGEAANWLRGEVVREINTVGKKRECHRMYRVMTTLTYSGDDNDIITLYIHYDDNEKG